MLYAATATAARARRTRECLRRRYALLLPTAINNTGCRYAMPPLPYVIRRFHMPATPSRLRAVDIIHTLIIFDDISRCRADA